MIQRKQTLFLLLAAVLGVVTLSLPVASIVSEGLKQSDVYNIAVLHTQQGASHAVWPLFAILLVASALCLYTIFIYKHRLVQAKLCVLSALLDAVWYLALAVVSFKLAPNAVNFHLSIVAALPAVQAILCMMARSAIMADERLVRAADRIR